MRYSQYLLPTLKETPGDAEVVSHQLMLRSGMIRKIAAGIYDYLPLGLRVIRKVEAIVREEMNRAGAIELLMPMVVPADLWEESGRWKQYGRELLRFKDRKETDFCLGPTHEEVITEIVRGTLRSYKQLPINLYQIQSKFRDEIRPRFGLMRGREFIMKDAYSFDLTDSDADEAYDKMYQAYRRIFQRCGLKFRAVEADTGNIGGTSSHEFMVLADSGEDAIVSCTICDYAANVEKAELRPPASSEKQTASLKVVVTPNRKTIEEVSAFLNVASQHTVKTLIVQTDTGEVVAVLLRGDRELNTIKLCHVLSCEWVELAPEDKIKQVTGAPSGFSGPVDLPLKIFADLEVEGMSDFVVGANQIDTHYTGANHGRDFSVTQFADLRQAESGDFCPRCDGTLEVWRGIEVGHVFKLGTKYSESMNATVLDEKGQERTLVMGCYGIGVGRTAAAAIEQNHDEFGIIWPMPLAPFQLIISVINPNDQTVLEAGEKLYQELLKQGIEVLFDDRDERPGSKFKDADLIGIPLRVNVGARALKEQSYELQDRRSGDRKMLSMHEAAEQLIKMIDDAMNVTAK